MSVIVSSPSLTLISSMATREVLAEMAAQYTSEFAQPVNTSAAGGVDVAKRVAAGEHFDIVVLADNAIDKLISAGKLLQRIDLVKSGIAIAVRQGATRYDINDEAAVKRAVVAAASLSYSTGPSGVYLEQLFERWDILHDIKNKLVVPPPGVPVGTLVSSGQCELGFQQLSELMNLPGIEVLGPLPASIQSITTFSGAVSSGSADPTAAMRVLQYMASPVTAAIKQRHGMAAA
jgi:molybdate transport system substrate-binding protein